MVARWEKVQLGLHLLLFSTVLYLALLLVVLWTGGYDPFGLAGLNRLGALAATFFQLSARLLLLAAPGRAWGFLALALDLAGWVLPFLAHGQRVYRLFHLLAVLVSLAQLRQLARHLERLDLARWVWRAAGLLGICAAGLGLAGLYPGLRWAGGGLAALSFGLACVRYLRLVYCLGDEVGKDLRLWRGLPN